MGVCMFLCLRRSQWLVSYVTCFFFAGIAVDGPGKDHAANISLFKKRGKVKALDEEIYSML